MSRFEYPAEAEAEKCRLLENIADELGALNSTLRRANQIALASLIVNANESGTPVKDALADARSILQSKDKPKT